MANSADDAAEKQTGHADEDRVAQRLESVEMAISHVQHDLESLSTSVNSILNRMKDLETRLTQFEQHAFAPRDEQELPDPLDEKPPHY